MKKFNLKNKKYGYLILAIIVLIIAIIVVSVLKKDKSEKSANNHGTPKTTEAAKKIKIVNPDTKSRPYAVMINNIGVARPLQSGLQDAYIIYEMIVEGGLIYGTIFRPIN